MPLLSCLLSTRHRAESAPTIQPPSFAPPLALRLLKVNCLKLLGSLRADLDVCHWIFRNKCDFASGHRIRWGSHVHWTGAVKGNISNIGALHIKSAINGILENTSFCVSRAGAKSTRIKCSFDSNSGVQSHKSIFLGLWFFAKAHRSGLGLSLSFFRLHFPTF